MSSASPSMCWKIRQSSRSDTEAISLTCGRHRSPLVRGMCDILEPRTVEPRCSARHTRHAEPFFAELGPSAASLAAPRWRKMAVTRTSECSCE